MDNLLALSKKMKKEADLILKKQKVMKTLSKYGKPVIIGSHFLDLMYGPDIDIIVLSKNPKRDSFDELCNFIKQSRFQKYEYGDFVKFKRKNRPQGFIVNLRTTRNSIKWEIEIWFLDSINDQLKSANELKNKISDNHRIKILKLKHNRARKKLSKYDLSSIDIYKKVLG